MDHIFSDFNGTEMTHRPTIPKAQYWFPAKRYGWGWGPPATWQGWVVLAVFFALMIIGSMTLLPTRGQWVFLAYTVVLCAVLVGICWLKGEPPRWRWGDQ